MVRKFNVKYFTPSVQELKKIGFDAGYLSQGLERHRFYSFKIYDLNPAQANILKQTAISCGTDCAVHRNTITGEAACSDCIISGSISEFRKICEKLKYQPFQLSVLGGEILSLIDYKPVSLKLHDKIFDWSKPLVMGIVNVTPDSFSDGGAYYEQDCAVEHALNLIGDGADIIDIGGESTRPYADIVNVDEEIGRVVPVIKKIREINNSVPISIDTRNAITAKEALSAGADFVNDISGLDYDEKMLDVVLESGCPFILNHSLGTPDIMQDNPVYADVVCEIYNHFLDKINRLCESGVDISRIIVDPGIGFGKTYEQNIEILRNIEQFRSLKLPLMVGHSRKSFLQKMFNTTDNIFLDQATSVVSDYLISKGVNILRVHNVKMLRQSVELSKVLNS